MKFLIGVDGGGSGTRAAFADATGRVIGRGNAGPSGLALGITQAWKAIIEAVDQAAREAGRDWAASDCALGAGLAGINHPQWRSAFLAANPGFGALAIDTDVGIALRAAHRGAPGLLIVAGTGSAGEALFADGGRRSVGGWGFPVGDEGSGAWLGLGAMRHAQCALDGRTPGGALARRVWSHCGDERDALLSWSLNAGQAGYADLAPLVFACAGQDPVAADLLDQAAQHLEAMALALDPRSQLPVALAGSIGIRLAERCSADLHQRLRGGDAEAALGALAMVQGVLERPR